MTDISAPLGFDVLPITEKTPRENTLEMELQKLKGSMDVLLGMEVHDVITKIAMEQKCNLAAVLGGPPCGKCAVCLVKDLELRLHDRWLRADWFRSQTIESMIQALEAGVATAKQQTAAANMILALREGFGDYDEGELFEAIKRDIEAELAE